MLNTNIQIQSTSSNIELMLEAFFCVQANEHVKAWRWHQHTSNYRGASDDALRDSLKALRLAQGYSK